MKAFIVTIGTLILMVNVWYFTTCLNTYNRQNDKLRWVASEAAAAGALYTDKEEESTGQIIFLDEQTLGAAETVIEKNLHLSSALAPTEDAYWQGPIEVTVYILDDSSCRVYRNGTLISTFAFTYPYLLSVSGTSFSHAIAHPAVCVSIDVGQTHLGGGLIQADTRTVRSSAYELLDKRN